MRPLALLLLLLLDMCQPTFAECLPPEAMEIHIGKQFPDVIEKRLVGRDAQSFLQAMYEVAQAEPGNLDLKKISVPIRHDANGLVEAYSEVDRRSIRGRHGGN
jgi:hypothetical protein